VATELHCDPALIAAIAWRESMWTPRHVTPDDGATGAESLGYMQPNMATVRAMPPPWRGLSRDALLKPRTNVEVGCRIYRWRLKRILEGRGYIVRTYEDVPHVLAAMHETTRREVIEQSVAAYTAGDVAIWAWPKLEPFIGAKMARVKTAYVQDVMRAYDWLQEGAGGAR